METKNIIITFIFLSFFTFPAIAEDAITDFTIVTPMPSGGIIAGSTYQTEYSFTGTFSSDVEINFTVYNPHINLSDWSVNYILNGNVTVPDEDYAGHFTSILPISAEDYNLIIVFKSIPNIIPGVYEFEVTLKADDIVIIVPDDDNGGRSSGRGTSPYTATPLGTLAPTPTPTPIPTILVQEVTSGDNVTIVIAATEEPTNLWSYWPLLILLFLILLFLYLRRKVAQNEEEEGVKK